MALAKKCDRCGKLYELYAGVLFTDNRKYYAVKFGNAGCSSDWLDLCPDCMERIIFFMEKK